MITIPGVDPDMIANNIVSSEPTHPGEVLREELECRNIPQTKLANQIGIKVSLLNERSTENATLQSSMPCSSKPH